MPPVCRYHTPSIRTSRRKFVLSTTNKKNLKYLYHDNRKSDYHYRRKHYQRPY